MPMKGASSGFSDTARGKFQEETEHLPSKSGGTRVASRLRRDAAGNPVAQQCLEEQVPRINVWPKERRVPDSIAFCAIDWIRVAAFNSSRQNYLSLWRRTLSPLYGSFCL